MAFIQRYSSIKKGGILFVGNTLGLSKLENQNKAGLLGSIGAFTSLNTNLVVNDFPAGTTLNYLQNGSNAVLTLPSNSNILYAELIWGGLYKSSTNNIENKIDDSIIFGTPLGNYTISPDTTTKQNFYIALNDINVGFYVRTANVTNYVTNLLNGTYFVGSVPAIIEPIDTRTNQTNHAGWTLAVIYSNDNATFRSLNLWVGGEVVSPNLAVTNFTLNGFKTPSTLNPSGKIFVSAQEGDAVLSGDQMLFGKDSSTLSNLYGPNNPKTNFFCSQINNQNGIIDTNGTFGSRNANANTASNTKACRQGYDITAIDITGKLASEQTSAYIRLTTDGDLYVPNAIAIQIDNGETPSISTIKSVDKLVATSGEILTYTTSITNTGSLPLYNTIFKDIIPLGTTFEYGSVKINGTNFATYNPQNGFTVGYLAIGQTVIVSFAVKVN